jgi:phosphatidylglycerophosphatase C
MNIAIYDLDKTITRRPTFTRFLIYFARRTAFWRLAALPIWIIALIGYRIGLYGRKPLKQFGIYVFMGPDLDIRIVRQMAFDFVTDAVLTDMQPGALKSIEKDRAQGHKLVIATAAPTFYAAEIGARLGFDAVVATQHVMRREGKISYLIDGQNCYGPEKLKMVAKWFDAQGLTRKDCHISVYSDHVSDARLMDWADAAYLVNPSKAGRRISVQKKWQLRDFSTDSGR